MAHTTRAAGAVLTTMIAAAAALVVSPAAQATTPLTATETRIADHPAFVRAVVDFTDGEIPHPSEDLVATDPEPFADGIARVRLRQQGVRTEARTARAHGVTVRVIQGRDRITVRLAATPSRFKYVSYFSLRNAERLVVDLWKSAPPVAAAEIRRAPDECLWLTRYDVARRHAAAAGRERDLFEHAFVVRLRAADGRILAQQPRTSAHGRWTSFFRYPAVRRQAGTLEAVASSAKDGALICLVQVKVRIGS
jgi:hypothetical protein